MRRHSNRTVTQQIINTHGNHEGVIPKPGPTPGHETGDHKKHRTAHDDLHPHEIKVESHIPDVIVDIRVKPDPKAQGEECGRKSLPKFIVLMIS